MSVCVLQVSLAFSVSRTSTSVCRARVITEYVETGWQLSLATVVRDTLADCARPTLMSA